MIKKHLLVASAACLCGLLVLALSAGILSANSKIITETNAVTIPSGPTLASVSTSAIDLKNTSDTDIRLYYSSLTSLGESERRGTNLLKNLKSVIHNLYYYSYADVWKIYEITDRDWVLSPASGDSYSTTSYNGTDAYTSYVYGTSTSSTGNNPYVRTLYRNRDSSGSIISSARIQEWTDHSITGTNREHVWPQSRGFKASTATGPAGTDVHHLMSGDAYVNQQIHNNYPYGNVDTTKSYTNGGATYSYDEGNYLGYSTHDSSSTNMVCEPQDCDKGDIARAVFYMSACYNNYAGTSGAISNYDPFLTVTNEIYASGSSSYSTDTTPVTMGILDDLLEWHKQDPVDEFEIHRNNLIYTNFQSNRNPFVDFPEWVDYIWGNKSTTGVAKPASDTINGYNLSLSLSDTSLNLVVGTPGSLTATSNDASSTISWTSSNTGVATINSPSTSGGISIVTITPVSEGNTTITASDGTNSAVCAVSVSATPILVTGITVSGNSSLEVGSTTTYTATVTPSNATNKNVVWSSGTQSVATIDSSTGVITGVSAGESIVTATAADGSGITGTKTISVATPTTIYYTKVTDAATLVSGATVVIAAEDYAYGMTTSQVST